jgi:hypothetical protein
VNGERGAAALNWSGATTALSFMSEQKSNSGFEPHRIIIKMTETEITEMTKQSPHLSGQVIVIDVKHLAPTTGRSSRTDRTTPRLRC